MDVFGSEELPSMSILFGRANCAVALDGGLFVPERERESYGKLVSG